MVGDIESVSKIAYLILDGISNGLYSVFLHIDRNDS